MNKMYSNINENSLKNTDCLSWYFTKFGFLTSCRNQIRMKGKGIDNPIADLKCYMVIFWEPVIIVNCPIA